MSELQGQLSLAKGLTIWEGFELVLPDQTLRFHAGTNEMLGVVIWQGNVYTPWPIQAQEFATPSQGSPARPKLQVGNFGGNISALCRQYEDLLGVKLKRRRTLVKYLDAVNFPKKNLLRHSEQFNNAAWLKAGTAVTSDAVAAPDGSVTADKIIESATSGVHYIYLGVAVTSGVTYTFSAFVKKAERNYAELTAFGTPYTPVRFDLTTGVVTKNTSGNAISASSDSLGGGWWRLSISVTSTITGGMNFGVSIFDTATGGSYLGDGVSGIYMWGAQLEQGQLTSYTPTTSVAGDNPYANPAEEYPVETWIITRKANETPAAIEFELGSPLDLQGVKLPRRQVVAGTCLWAYRSGECGYGGGPVADYADNPTSDPSKDQCSRTMRGCKKRFGENGELPFGGFPGIARVPRL